MTALNHVCTTVTLGSWQDLVQFYEERSEDWRRWIFRGHQDASWGLETSLERATSRFDVASHEVAEVEDGLERKFRREAHQHLTHVPEKEDRIGWLALMQHHGAPTRLLDWTYSFYVAAYFAVERARSTDTCAVWALDAEWWSRRTQEHLPSSAHELLEGDPRAKEPATVRAIVYQDPPSPLIYSVNPYRLNERLIIQQGLFLAPGDVTQPFEENLLAHAGDESGHLYKLVVPCGGGFLREALLSLNRVNIGRATLFPGLDGFSAHLGNLIAIPEAIPPTGRRTS